MWQSLRVDRSWTWYPPVPQKSVCSQGYEGSSVHKVGKVSSL